MNSGLRLVEGETATRRLIVGLLESIAQGFAEAGCPLSDEQQGFLDGAIEAMVR